MTCNKWWNSLQLCMLMAVCWGLTSCDPLVNYQQRVNNVSDYEIVLTIHTDTIPQTVSLQPGEGYVIFEISEIATVNEFENCVSNVFAPSLLDIEIITTNNDTFNQDLTNQSIWNFIIIDENSFGGGECACYYNMVNEDFE